MTLIWFVVWLIADNIGDHEPLLLDPPNVWAATLILAVALVHQQAVRRTSAGKVSVAMTLVVDIPNRLVAARRLRGATSRATHGEQAAVLGNAWWACCLAPVCRIGRGGA
jgi:hypothetical protein